MDDSFVYLVDDRPRALTIPIRTPSSAPRAPEDQVCLLLHRMAHGDESALATLYDQWCQRVHAIAFWILKDSDDAEDVVEETFWQAWRTAGQFDRRRGSASTWLIMIARSRALDRLRAQRRRIERTATAAAAMLLGDPVGAVQPAALQPELAESSTVLTQALNALPPEQRDALQLAFIGGLSHAEIAAQTGQPLGTIKTRIRMAMDKLRQRLGSMRDQAV